MKLFALLTSFFFALASCQAEEPKNGKFKDDVDPMPEAKTETITLGAGCYWCVEAIFQQLDGVLKTTNGFMGGHIPDPTYEQVSTKTTGHIEVIEVVFDPEKISTKTILKWFWKSHDPTDGGGQGADRGPQYRTTIFFHSPEQQKLAEESKKIAQQAFDKPIATVIEEAEKFYPAQKDHQDYYFRMKKKNPYCRAVITPKLDKLNLEK